MPREHGRGHQPHMSMMPLMFPLQQFGSVFLENIKQISDFQMDVARSYTHFAVGQMRDALEIRDPDSLREYFEKQSRATGELTRKITKDAERAMEASEEAARRSLSLVQRGGQMAQEVMREGAEQARAASEQMERTARHVQHESQQRNGGLAIDRYDELSIDEIEQRLDKLSSDQIRHLSDYERKNKNRKTLSEAFQRRLSQ